MIFPILVTVAAVYLFQVDPGGGEIQIVKDASLTGVLIWLVFGAMQEWWVPGRTHRRVVAERDKALMINDAQAEINRRALDVALAIKEGGPSR